MATPQRTGAYLDYDGQCLIMNSFCCEFVAYVFKNRSDPQKVTMTHIFVNLNIRTYFLLLDTCKNLQFTNMKPNDNGTLSSFISFIISDCRFIPSTHSILKEIQGAANSNKTNHENYILRKSFKLKI